MLGSIYGLSLDGSDEYRYIGMTRQPIEKRLDQHRRESRKSARDGAKHRQPVYNWIRKYGEQAIRISLIEECALEDLGDREKHFIKHYERVGHRLLNVAIGGGNNRPTTEEARRNYSRAFTGHPGYMTGHRWSPEEIEQIRQRSTGRMHSEESKRKMSQVRMGIKFTDDHRMNLSLAHRKPRKITQEQIDQIRSTEYSRPVFLQLAKEWGLSESTMNKYRLRTPKEVEA